MHGLCDEAAVRAQLSVASYRSALALVDEEPGAEGGTRPRLGEKVPCHCSAAGKVLLAHRARWCESVLSRPLEAHTDRTLVDPKELRAHLQEVRQRGYSVEDSEHVVGEAGIAAPVLDYKGEAVAALGVTVGSTRLAADGSQLAAMVALAARRLSDELGFVPGAVTEDEGVPAAVLDMVPAARSYAA